MNDILLNSPSSYLPDLNRLECSLLRHSPWADALREKERLLESVGLDEMLGQARRAKMLQRKYFAPWVHYPESRQVFIPKNLDIAFQVLTEWWENHPFACGGIAFVCEGAGLHPGRNFPYVPSPLNLIFPNVEYFTDSLHEFGLPSHLVDAARKPVYPLFGVLDPNVDISPNEDDFFPHELPEGFGWDAEPLVNDRARMIATVRYMARRARIVSR
jgi:hypothetical protein